MTSHSNHRSGIEQIHWYNSSELKKVQKGQSKMKPQVGSGGGDGDGGG